MGRNNEPLSEHGSDDPERGLKRERGIGVFDHMDYNHAIFSFYLMACSHWHTGVVLIVRSSKLAEESSPSP